MGVRIDGTSPAAILVVALVVLAGCRLPATGPAAGPTVFERTVTPVAVETQSPGSVSSTAASGAQSGEIPGIVGSRVTDVDALLSAHERHLVERSYTLVWSRRVSGQGAGVPDTTRQEVAVENESRFRIRITDVSTGGEQREHVAFVDRTGVYRLGANATVSPSAHALARSIDVRRLFARRPLPVARSLLSPDATTVTYSRHDGTRYARLVTRRLPPSIERTYDHDVRGFSATVWVHPDGYLRSVYYQLTLVRDGGRATVSERYSYAGLGTTVVTEPRWVERLKADAGLTLDGPSTDSPGSTPALTPIPNRTATPTTASGSSV